MLTVAALVESRFDRIGNTFLADGRGEAAPRTRCHSFSFRTATHEREFKTPSRALAGNSTSPAPEPRRAVAPASPSETAACQKTFAPVAKHPEPEVDAAPIRYPTLLGRGPRFSVSVSDDKKGSECKPNVGFETAVLTSTAPPVARRWKTDAGVLLEAVSSPQAEAEKEPEKVQGAATANDLALPICKRSRRKQKTPTAGCETPSTAASSTTASPAKGGSFQGASPAAAVTKPKRPDRLVQEDLIRQLMQTGASAMARANVIAKDMAAA